MNDLTSLSLANINSGAAEEMFAQAIQLIDENIADPNYTQTAARMVTVKIVLKPDAVGGKVDVTVTCDTSLPKRNSHSQAAYKMADGSWAQGTDPRALQTEMENNIHRITPAKAV